MPYKFKLGNRSGSCSYEVLDKNGLVFLSYVGESCLSGMFIQGYGKYKDSIDEHTEAKQIRHDIRCYHADDYEGMVKYLDYMFSKDSPFRQYISHFKIERDEKQRPVSFICDDIDEVPMDVFGGLAVAVRMGYENAGSYQLFNDALKNGVPMHMAVYLLNTVRYPSKFGVFDKNIYVPTICYHGGHGLMNCKKFVNFDVFKKGISYPTGLLSIRSGTPMTVNRYFESGSKSIIYKNLFTAKKEYTGSFKMLYDRLNATSNSRYYNHPLPVPELFKLLKKAA